MDLGTIMKKIDEHCYNTPKQWVSDIEQISRNALEYVYMLEMLSVTGYFHFWSTIYSS